MQPRLGHRLHLAEVVVVARLQELQLLKFLQTLQHRLPRNTSHQNRQQQLHLCRSRP